MAFACAHGADWRRVIASLGRPGRGLGFVYFTDSLVGQAKPILEALKQETGIDDWIGSVGTGVLAAGVEYQDGPAMAAMVSDLEGFAVFSGRTPLRPEAVAQFAVVHADPSAPDLPGLVSDMSSKVSTGFIVGGVSSSRANTVQIANEVLSGGLSGAVVADAAAVATRLTQGCTPYPGRFRVTKGEGNVIAALDGRPALKVLLESVRGENAQVLVGLLVPGDAGAHFPNYTARNLVGVDPKKGLIAIGDVVEPGTEVVFCKRDAAAARKDLESMLSGLAVEVPRPRGALYYSCVARGEHMFGSRGAELQLVRQALGEIPLVGFFCNGEISRDRLYGYTGVLTVFR